MQDTLADLLEQFGALGRMNFSGKNALALPSSERPDVSSHSPRSRERCTRFVFYAEG